MKNSKKDIILDLLYNAESEWISGETISSRIGISRTAVWKYINMLRDSGYDIESTSRLGHRLISCFGTMNEFEIRRNLKSDIFGRTGIFFFKEIASTNNEAFNLASSGALEGTIVIAESQTGGRGRFGRKWVSPPGKNLILSLIARPEIPPDLAPRMTIVTAVALSDTLRAFGINGHRIKWPNDILFNNRKLSGILVEMKSDPDRVDFLIIGIGVNINSSGDDFPENISGQVISMMDITGMHHDRVKFLAELLLQLEKSYILFVNNGFDKILSRWIEISGIIGRIINVTGSRGSFTGTVTGLNDDGNLIVKTADGSVYVNSGEIEFINGNNI